MSPLARAAVPLKVHSSPAAAEQQEDDIKDDPQAVTTTEYKRVQAAKIIHRIVSGTHKRWEQPRSDGGTLVTELHKFPMSRGRVLRHIGEDIERAAELIVDKHLEDITAFKKQREEDGKLGRRAHPERVKGLPKRAKERAVQQTPARGQASAGGELGKDGKRKRPYSVTLSDGTIVTYN